MLYELGLLLLYVDVYVDGSLAKSDVKHNN